MNKRNIKPLLKKTWWFIWEDNSIWSWIVNVILAFIIIKFLVYPGLGFILQTNYPIVAVVSESMEHNGNFDRWWGSSAMCGNTECAQKDWYSQTSISKEDFVSYPFKNGFNKGDIMVLYGTKPENIKKGDVIVFKSQRPDPIIHRVVRIEEKYGIFNYQTKGDHNSNSIEGGGIDETNIGQDRVVGYEKYKKASKAVLRIPYLGYIKIWFVELISLFRW